MAKLYVPVLFTEQKQEKNKRLTTDITLHFQFIIIPQEEHPSWDKMKASGFVNLGYIIGNYLRNELLLPTNETVF